MDTLAKTAADLEQSVDKACAEIDRLRAENAGLIAALKAVQEDAYEWRPNICEEVCGFCGSVRDLKHRGQCPMTLVEAVLGEGQ